jgi:predicted metalloprotease with PDZ domain
LTFNDYLTALSRAYDGSSGAPELNQLSLLEASKRRFTTGAAGVYAKAMLVAFIYDLNLRYQTQGKRSLDDVYRRIFRSQKTGDGNAIVMAALSAEFDRQNFVARFVTQPVSIDLQSELAPFGLHVEKSGFRTRIVVNEKLSKRQRDLLRDLGYNDRTR